MVEQQTVTGMVLSAMPIHDFDMRVLLLTREKGKITAFAKGARRQNSPFLAGCRPFSFGTFTLYAGKNSYGITQIQISEYFMELTQDFFCASYGFYFLEVADYYGREGVDAKDSLNLLYASFHALMKHKIPPKLIRAIYELKSLAINGEYPDVFSCNHCGSKESPFYFDFQHKIVFCKECVSNPKKYTVLNATLVYALQFVITQPMNQIYTFTLKEEYMKEFIQFVSRLFQNTVHREFKSLEILETLES